MCERRRPHSLGQNPSNVPLTRWVFCIRSWGQVLTMTAWATLWTALYQFDIVKASCDASLLGILSGSSASLASRASQTDTSDTVHVLPSI